MKFENIITDVQTEQNTITFNITDTDYKLNLVLMLLLADAMNTTNFYTIQNKFDITDTELSLFTVDCKVDYIFDEEDSEKSSLIFMFTDADAKRQLVKLLDKAVTKDNFMKVVEMLLNKLCEIVETEPNTNKALCEYADYIITRQMLIELFNFIGYKGEVRKATRYISNNNIHTLRFSHLQKYKVALKNAMKAV